MKPVPDLPLPDEAGAEQRLPMRRPLIALALTFCLGILLGDVFQVPAWLAWALAGLALGGCFLARLRRWGGPLRFLLWLGVVASLGMARAPAPIRPQVSSAAFPSGTVVLTAEAQSGWEKSGAGRRLVVDGLSIAVPGQAALGFTNRIRLTVIEDEPFDGAAAETCVRILPGDRLRALVRMRALVPRRNPGVADPAQRLRQQGIQASGVVLGCSNLLLVRDVFGSGLRRWAEWVRAEVGELIGSRAGSSTGRALLTALTTGAPGGLPDSVRDDFRRAGLAHLLAVSGLHLGCVALGLYFLLLFGLVRIEALALRMDVRRIAAALVVPVVLFYLFLAGARLPAMRACVVVICFLLAVMVRRRPDPLQTLSAACLVVLGLWPASLFEVSFQLSFSAAASVLLIAPRLANGLRVPFEREKMPADLFRRIRARTVQLLVVSAAASLGTAPLVAWYFHQVSPIGLVCNILAVPLAAWLIVPLGLVCALFAGWWPGLAGWVADLGIWLSDGLAWIAHAFGSPNWVAWSTAGPSLFEIVCWYLGLLLVLGWRRFPWARWGATAALLGLALSWVLTWLNPWGADGLHLVVFDVGQGESLLVELPDGRRLLIDGGGSHSSTFDTGRHVVAPALWARGVTDLDVVVASHRHPDHVGGLAFIVDHFSPDEVWTVAPLEEEEVSRPLAAAANRVGAQVRVLSKGDRPLEMSKGRLEVLWPPADGDDLTENERSLVLRLSYGERSFLLTADLEREGERALLASGVDLAADVLKVGHHGSRYATSQGFLSRVAPSQAIISVGARNPYRLPSLDVLKRLRKNRTQVWSTDRHGAVQVWTDGQQLRVEAVQKRPARPKVAPVAVPEPSKE